MQKILPFYAVLKYSAVSQSHTTTFFFSASAEKFQFLAFFPTLKLQILENHFPIPPPFYLALAIGHCFTYHFFKDENFFAFILSDRPFLCSPT